MRLALIHAPALGTGKKYMPNASGEFLDTNVLILEAAAAAGCRVLQTEDLNHGQVIRGVRVKNPFVDSD